MTECGLFDVKIWGTVGQWVSAIGTISLGLVSLFLASRGEKRARDLDARQIIQSISFTENPVRTGATLRVINAGTTPVRDLRVPYMYMDSSTGDEVEVMYTKDLLRPGDEDELELNDYSYNCTPEFVLEVTDIHNRRWRKGLGGAVTELTPSVPGRARRGWRWVKARASAIRASAQE